MGLNPLKQFNYDIEIDGLAQFVAQEVTTPEITIGEVEHGEGNEKRRTPGMIAYGDLTISMLKVAPSADDWAYNWFDQIKNGSVPTTYLKNVTIRLKSEDGKTAKTIECKECWIKKLGGLTLSQTAEDNIMEEVVFACNGLETR